MTTGISSVELTRYYKDGQVHSFLIKIQAPIAIDVQGVINQALPQNSDQSFRIESRTEEVEEGRRIRPLSKLNF
jgi:hypothetical protein